MDKLTLDQKLEQLQKEFLTKKKEVIRQYCDARNPYKIGDKFTDHIGTIVVESIAYLYAGEFGCVYFGAELKKDGTPRKDNSKRNVYQSNERISL